MLPVPNKKGIGMDADTKFLINRIDKLDRKLSKQIERVARKIDPIVALRNKIIGATIAINVVFTFVLNMILRK